MRVALLRSDDILESLLERVSANSRRTTTLALLLEHSEHELQSSVAGEDKLELVFQKVGEVNGILLRRSEEVYGDKKGMG